MKKILIIGAGSKISKKFQLILGDDYEIIKTARDSSLGTVHLDLLDIKSVKKFIKSNKNNKFCGVFIFASTYMKDPEDLNSFYDHATKDLQVNALNPYLIIRSLNLEDMAKVFLFGDAGLGVPKKGHTSYSLSKLILEQVTRNLAVELSEKNISVINFLLGPTEKAGSVNDQENYKNRCIIDIEDPGLGLARLCRHMLEEKNLNITGATITYDGGAYLKRPS